MQILLGLLAVIGLILFWQWQSRQASGVGRQNADVRSTVRRVMSQAGGQGHPADQVEDPKLAAAGIVVAVASMDAPFSQREIAALTREAQAVFEVSERDALDIVSFGRWVAGQCASNEEAVMRLSDVVAREAGPEAASDLVRMITDVATADGHALGEDEQSAIDTVRRTLGVH